MFCGYNCIQERQDVQEQFLRRVGHSLARRSQFNDNAQRRFLTETTRSYTLWAIGYSLRNKKQKLFAQQYLKASQTRTLSNTTFQLGSSVILTPPMDGARLADRICEAALNAVRTQQVLDRGHVHDVAIFLEMWEHSSPETRELLRPLAPPRQVAACFEMELSLAIGRSNSEVFAINADILNSHYEVFFRARRENHSRFCVTVVQYPIPNGGSHA